MTATQQPQGFDRHDRRSEARHSRGFSVGPARGGARPAIVAALVAAAAAVQLSLSSFHALQLPPWSAWIAGGVAGFAVLSSISALARRGRRAAAWGVVAALVIVAVTAAVLDYRQPSAQSARVLERPLVVVLPATSSPLHEFVLESLQVMSGFDIVATGRGGMASDLAAPSLELGDDGGLMARFRDASGELAWTRDYAADRAPAELAVDLLQGVAASLAARPGSEGAGAVAAPAGLAPRSATDFGPYFEALGDWRQRGPHRVDADGLLEALDRVMDREPGFAPAAALRANIAFAAGIAVEPDARRVLAGMQAEARSRQALAMLAAVELDAASARERVAEAIALNPSDPWIRLDAAMIHAWLNECRDALMSAERALALAPDAGSVRLAAAEVLFLCGAFDRALVVASGAEGGVAGGADTELLRASIHVARGDAPAARESLERYEAGRDGPRQLDAMAAYLYFRAGILDEAGPLTGESAGADTGEAEASVTGSLASMARGDYLSALRMLRGSLGRQIGAADIPIVVGIARNAWMDPVLNEPAFRDVRQNMQLR